MILDIEKSYDGITLSYFNKEGDTEIKDFKIGYGNFDNWVLCSENDQKKSSEFKNWDGRPVKKVKGKSFTKWSLYEFMEHLPEEIKSEVLSPHYPKMYSIDIEVEQVNGTWSSVEDAEGRITTIAISTEDGRIIVLGWKDLESKDSQNKIQKSLDSHFKDHKLDFSFQYINFKSEYDMMFTFFNKLLPKFALCTGWNFIRFDWTYLYNRCLKLGIDPASASPRGKLNPRDNYPLHLGLIDYLDIYKRWDRTVALKENNTLDFVSSVVLGINKIKYDGSLQDLYEQDYDKYVFYNAVDAALVTLIHQKIRTTDTIFTTASMANLNIYKASSAVNLTEALLFKEYYKNKMVIADSFRDKERGNYEGAYVKQPILGRHDSVACFDFASLYPSIMREINVSPESFIEKIKDPEKLEEYKKKDNIIVSCTGAVYKKEDSVLKSILTDLYADRKGSKRKHMSLEIEIDRLERILQKK
jgi:DNA polymerase elongation subunit (family B)